MIKLWLCRLIIMVVMLFLATTMTRADSRPVNLSADEVHYNYEQKQIEASGHVLLTYQDIHVTANHVLIDQDQNILVANGAVILQKKNETYHGETFLFYLKTEQGWLAPLNAGITDPEIRGVISLDAAWALIKKDDLILDHSSFTGCDLAQPHYHLTADSIEYYPNERIIFHHLWYWEHQYKLFYLPYLVIALDDKDDNFEAQFGWQRDIGWFLQIGYNYFLNQKNDGKIKLKLTEKGGESIGVEHHYKSSPTTKWTGEADLIYHDNLSSRLLDYNGDLKYENWTNPKLQVLTEAKEGSYHDSSGSYYIKNFYNFYLNSQSPYPGLNVTYNQDTSYHLESLDVLTKWSYQFDPTLQGGFNGHFFSQRSDYLSALQENFLYNLTAFKNLGWSNLTLKYNDMNVYSGSSYSINLKPDLTMNIPSWKWPVLGDMRVGVQYTNQETFYFLNGNAAITSGRREALNIEKPNVPLWQNQGKNLTLKGNGLLQVRYYQVADQDSDLEALTGGVSLADQFSKEFSGELGFNLTQLDGVPHPFFTENIYPGATITNNWHWRSSHLNADLNMGYNLQNDIPIPANLTVHYLFNPKERLDFSTVYNWPTGLGATTFQAFYNPNEKWLVNLALGYDFQYEAWTNKNFEAQINDRLSQKIRYELAARFDFLQNSFTIAKIGLAYDLHCRELMFRYDWVQQTYTVLVLFKAFPQVPLELNPGYSEFVF